MYLGEVLSAALLVEEVEENHVVLLPSDITNWCDRAMVVDREVWSQLYVKYRAQEPDAEYVMSALLNSPSTKLYEDLSQLDVVRERFRELRTQEERVEESEEKESMESYKDPAGEVTTAAAESGAQLSDDGAEQDTYSDGTAEFEGSDGVSACTTTTTVTAAVEGDSSEDQNAKQAEYSENDVNGKASEPEPEPDSQVKDDYFAELEAGDYSEKSSEAETLDDAVPCTAPIRTAPIERVIEQQYDDLEGEEYRDTYEQSGEDRQPEAVQVDKLSAEDISERSERCSEIIRFVSAYRNIPDISDVPDWATGCTNLYSKMYESYSSLFMRFNPDDILTYSGVGTQSFVDTVLDKCMDVSMHRGSEVATDGKKFLDLMCTAYCNSLMYCAKDEEDEAVSIAKIFADIIFDGGNN